MQGPEGTPRLSVALPPPAGLDGVALDLAAVLLARLVEADQTGGLALVALVYGMSTRGAANLNLLSDNVRPEFVAKEARELLQEVRALDEERFAVYGHATNILVVRVLGLLIANSRTVDRRLWRAFKDLAQQAGLQTQATPLPLGIAPPQTAPNGILTDEQP